MDNQLTENRLVAMYVKQGRYGQAEPLALAAYYRKLKSLGPDAAATKQQVNQLDQLYTGDVPVAAPKIPLIKPRVRA
jgi:hypothetical protein